MPTYDLVCRDCGKKLSVIQAINEKLPERCECGGTLTQCYGVPSIRFVGPGFHVNDYPSGS